MKHTIWSVGELVRRSFGYFVREVAQETPTVEGFATLRSKCLEGDPMVALANHSKIEGLVLLGLERCNHEDGTKLPFVVATFMGGQEMILSCPTRQRKARLVEILGGRFSFQRPVAIEILFERGEFAALKTMWLNAITWRDQAGEEMDTIGVATWVDLTHRDQSQAHLTEMSGGPFFYDPGQALRQ